MLVKLILDRLMMVITLVIIYTLLIYDSNFQSGQPVKVEFKLSKVVPKYEMYGYALVLTNRLISISSEQ